MRRAALVAVILSLGFAPSSACVSSDGEARRIGQAAEVFHWDVEMSEGDLRRLRAEIEGLEKGPARAALRERADELSGEAVQAHRALDEVATVDALEVLRDDIARLREAVAALRLATVRRGS
jgi:hypothetical protein